MFFTSITFLIRLYPFDWTDHCAFLKTTLCGPKLCTITGTWHIGWMLPLNNLFEYKIFGMVFGSALYTITSIVLPIFYGSWKFNVFHALVGPILSFIIAGNLNEWPAVWCFFSVLIMFTVLSKKLEKSFHVRGWFLWGNN